MRKINIPRRTLRVTILLQFFILNFAFCIPLFGAEPPADILNAFNPSMQRYLRGCLLLMEGVSNNSNSQVAKANDLLDFEYENPAKELSLASLKVDSVDNSDVLPLQNCFEFNYRYGERWIETYGKGPFVEGGESMRTIPGVGSVCKIFSVRLKPHSKAVYSMKQKGKCGFFAVYEPMTDVSVDLHTNAVAINTENVDGFNLWTAHWDMPAKDSVTITLSNNSDSPSTILIASN